MDDLPQALSVTRIADLVGEPVWRVRYILMSRRVEPRVRAGKVFIYGPEAVDVVREACEAIEARRGAKHGIASK